VSTGDGLGPARADVHTVEHVSACHFRYSCGIFNVEYNQGCQKLWDSVKGAHPILFCMKLIRVWRFV